MTSVVVFTVWKMKQYGKKSRVYQKQEIEMFQTLIFAGNVGKDPVMKYTPNGKAVTSFTVASTRKYNSADGTVKETIWFSVSTWDKLAELCNTSLKKGSKVLIEGRLVPAENGHPKIYKKGDDTVGANYDVCAITVRFLDPKESTGQEEEGDNIPF
jgi:single-strand DNA-binding protein